ncbi:DNA-binding transcription factor [Lithospermum erythrorhizon]|uniref:DNA-binding transcription factor n=1 Tax=Lithospermum erythrorhizon TaxID=34254 RepID=A0AAV3QE31_LITER
MENGEEKKDELVFLDRSSRATRGKRMNKLLDEEVEEDEVFWNQEALKDEENDIEYEAEPEAADVCDSDFDIDEPDPDEQLEKEPDENTRPKRRLIFPGKQLPKKKNKKKSLSKLEKEHDDESAPQDSTPSEHHDTHDDTEKEKIVRKSTRTAVVVRQAERDANRAALQATMKPIKRRKEGEEKKMTQEEMLLEAAQTEIMNVRNLERVLAKEEEVKKKAVVHKAIYSGPQIRYLSKNGYSYLEYINGASFHSELSTASTPSYYVSFDLWLKLGFSIYSACFLGLYFKRDHLSSLFFLSSDLQKETCAVTGLPARYRDPKTGLPYATLEAFKIIRERLSAESKRGRERSLGGLSDDICGLGFGGKRKRSTVQNRRSASHRSSFRHFHTISASEEDSYSESDSE